jgi:hypothetical protein
MKTRWFRTFTTVASLLSALALADDPRVLANADPGAELSATFVGQLQRRCCRPGRRYGCDPQNFQQTGCVHIDQQIPSCYASQMVRMRCTGATCEAAGIEDVCDVRLRTVGQNRCRPLGTRTTVGCPPDHWQCNIQLYRYTLADAPQVDVMVCELGTSTICGYSYSACD